MTFFKIHDFFNQTIKLLYQIKPILKILDFSKYLRMASTLIQNYFIWVQIKYESKMSENNDDTKTTFIGISNDEEESNAKGKIE